MLQDAFDIRFEVIRPFQHFAIRPVNRFSIRPQLAHIASLYLGKYGFDLILHPVLQNGATEYVQHISQGVGHLHEVSTAGGIQVFLIFLPHELVAQQVLLQGESGTGVVFDTEAKGPVEFRHCGYFLFHSWVCLG